MAGKHVRPGTFIETDDAVYGPFRDRRTAENYYDREFYGIRFGRIITIPVSLDKH